MKIILVGIFAFFLYWLQGIIYRKIWNRKLKVSLHFEENSLLAGQQGHLLETVENEKHFPLPILKVKFQCNRELEFETSESAVVTDLYYRNDVFSIMPMQKITRCLTFTAKKRGYYRIKEVDLLGTDYLFSSENICNFSTEAFLYVYPRPIQNHKLEQVIRQISGQIPTKQLWPEDPFEYRGIREYQPNDDMSRINWKATAKTDELKVNERNATTLNTIRIFVNLEDSGILKKEELIEETISLTAGITEFFTKQDFGVSLYCNCLDCVTEQPIRIAESTGESHMEIISRSLARLNTKEMPVDFEQEFEKELKEQLESSYSVFVTVNLYESFLKVLTEYQKSGNPFSCLVPVRGESVWAVPKDLEGKIQFFCVEDK